MRLVKAKSDFNFVSGTSHLEKRSKRSLSIVSCSAKYVAFAQSIIQHVQSSHVYTHDKRACYLRTDSIIYPLVESLWISHLCVYEVGKLLLIHCTQECGLNTIPFCKWSNSLGWVTQVKIIIAEEREVFAELKWKFIFQLHCFLLFNSLCPVLPKCKSGVKLIEAKMFTVKSLELVKKC